MIPFRSQCFICLLAHLRRCTTKNNNITRVKDNKQALPPCIRQGRPEALHSFYASLCIRKCNNQKKSGQQRIKRKIDKKTDNRSDERPKRVHADNNKKDSENFFGQTTGSQKKTKKQKTKSHGSHHHHPTTTTTIQERTARKGGDGPRAREEAPGSHRGACRPLA